VQFKKKQDFLNMKKDGGLIRSWQLHHLILPDIEGLEEKFLETFPGVLLDPGPMKFSGTVIEDSAGRYKPGWHMISSYICSIDRKRGVIETMNTIYKVIDEGNDELPDMGNDILNVFY
jgi:hypothetical protein